MRFQRIFKCSYVHVISSLSYSFNLIRNPSENFHNCFFRNLIRFRHFLMPCIENTMNIPLCINTYRCNLVIFLFQRQIIHSKMLNTNNIILLTSSPCSTHFYNIRPFLFLTVNIFSCQIFHNPFCFPTSFQCHINSSLETLPLFFMLIFQIIFSRNIISFHIYYKF